MTRVGYHFSRAHGGSGRRKSPWNLLLVPLAIAGIAGTWMLLVMGLLRVQEGLIPDTVILWSHARAGGIFLFVPPLFPALAIGMMLANLVAWCLTPVRRIFQREAEGIEGASFGDAMRHLFLASLILLAIISPLSLIGVTNYFYVTESGVTVNPLWAIREVRYEWSDLVAVRTRCLAERNNLHLNFVLYMSDGREVDLLEEPRLKFIAVYNRIKPLIRAQTDVRYSSDIRADGLERLRSRYNSDQAEQILEVLGLNF